MLKIRSMVIGADKTGTNTTGARDSRITVVGRFIRRYKLDEISQFWNVACGDMSVVGPRPNTRSWGINLYTQEEMRLLDVRPGITDLSSIVFSDEGEIIGDADHPDLYYNQVIRPWKSRLGLFYIENSSLWLDVRICWLTVLAVTNKAAALSGIVSILEGAKAESSLIDVCRRQGPLPKAPPPGEYTERNLVEPDCHA